MTICQMSACLRRNWLQFPHGEGYNCLRLTVHHFKCCKLCGVGHMETRLSGYSVLRPMLKMNCNFSPQRGASTEIEGETIDESDSRHRATMVCFLRSLILSINTTARFPFLPSTISLCGLMWSSMDIFNFLLSRCLDSALIGRSPSSLSSW